MPDFGELTDEDLERLSTYTEADIDEAVEQWDNDASPDMRGLLDAEPEEPKP